MTGVSLSGFGQWYCFRGSVYHTGWMDSNNNYIDDLTEETYIPKTEINPGLNTEDITFSFPFANPLICIVSLIIFSNITFFWKKEKILS
ncbi:MAG: hypothetical protein U9O98_00820 [Asgard group archaeon]|nr:hypothetical protein [Asgard group archaeon]